VVAHRTREHQALSAWVLSQGTRQDSRGPCGLDIRRVCANRARERARTMIRPCDVPGVARRKSDMKELRCPLARKAPDSEDIAAAAAKETPSRRGERYVPEDPASSTGRRHPGRRRACPGYMASIVRPVMSVDSFLPSPHGSVRRWRRLAVLSGS